MPDGPSRTTFSPRRSLHRHCLLLTLACLAVAVSVHAQVHEAGEPGLDPPRRVEGVGQEPVYPETALRDGIQGTVILRLVVDAAGRVSDVEVFRSPFKGESLAEAAAAAARTWLFEPARLDGRNVACRIIQTVPFHPPSPAKAEPRSRRGRKKKQAPPTPEPLPRSGKPAAEAPSTPAIPPPREQPAPPDQPPAAEPQAVAPAEQVPATKPGGATPSGVPPAGKPEAVVPPRPSGQAVAEPERLPKRRQEPDMPLRQPTERAAVAPPVPAAVAPPRPDVIDITNGGPHGITLGLAATAFRARFPGTQQQGDRVRLTDLGIEVVLGETVESIHYLFAGGGGLQTSTLRTRKGLGPGSSCLGVVPAYGRPEEGAAFGGESGRRVVYRRGSVRASFVCRDGRLAELILESGVAP
jgi:TonB family protein